MPFCKKFVFLFTAAILMICGSSFAEENLASKRVKSTVDEVLALIKEVEDTDRELEDIQVEVRTAIEKSFSFDQISRRVLGRNWRKLKPDEQTKFTELFSTLLISTYMKSFDQFNIDEVRFDKEIFLSDSRMEIQSAIISGNTETAVFYRLILFESEWQVYDAIVEGVSLVNNYRKQFNSLLQRGSVKKLFAAMEKLIATNKKKQKNA